MLTDIQLLSRYAKDSSEQAFGELVARHVNLVYSTALRIVGGDQHAACDVAQSVFTDLARKAVPLCNRVKDEAIAQQSNGQSLTGWLYTSTRFAAAKSVRADQIRRKHEQKACVMNTLGANEPDSPDWTELRPVIDEALGTLDGRDRDALLFRFFEGEDLRAVGIALGLSEDAARMRISRALDKLREVLVKRGVTTTAGALSVTLATHTVQAAPVGLTAAITAASIGAVALTSSTPTIVLQFMASLKSKIAFAALLAASVATPLFIQQTAMSKLRVENEALHAQLAVPQTIPPSSQTSAPDPNETSRVNSQETELLRLRGEVTRLRAEAARRSERTTAQAAVRPSSRPADTARGFEMYSGDVLGARHVDTIKMMKMVGIALRRLEQDPAISAEVRAMPFSEDNDLRTELKKSISLPDEEWNQFEILVPNLDILTQNKSDSGLIVARSKEPIQTPDGRWIRIYTRVDGSVINLVHDSATKAFDFGELENSTRASNP